MTLVIVIVDEAEAVHEKSIRMWKWELTTAVSSKKSQKKKR